MMLNDLIPVLCPVCEEGNIRKQYAAVRFHGEVINVCLVCAENRPGDTELLYTELGVDTPRDLYRIAGYEPAGTA
jgi:hypothetical protein